MDFTKMFVGGALIGTLISCWGFIKGCSWQILAVVLRREKVDYDVAKHIAKYLENHYGLTKFRERSYHSQLYRIKDINKDKRTIFEFYGSLNMLFWYDIIPIFISGAQKEEGKVDSFYVYYLRNSIDFLQLINKSNDYYNKLREATAKERFFIKKFDKNTDNNTATISGTSYNFTENLYKFITEKEENLGFASKAKVEDLILTKELEEVVKIAELWKVNQDWYNRKSITWKTGWLLWGEPGTGKTALARAVGKKLDIPIYIFRLAGITNKKFEEQWNLMRGGSPCIALMEDFDNIFHGRNNITKICSPFSSSMNIDFDEKKVGEEKKDKDQERSMMFGDDLTFDTFINLLDGVEQYDGIFTIITTNNLDKVDSALINRPGRIDKVLNLTHMTTENKYRLVDKILGDMPEVHEVMVDWLKDNEEVQLTPAQLQEKCSHLALKGLYGK